MMREELELDQKLTKVHDQEYVDRMEGALKLTKTMIESIKDEVRKERTWNEKRGTKNHH